MSSQPQTLVHRLRSYLTTTVPYHVSKTDSRVSHITRLLSSTANVDITLLTLTYTLHLLHSVLSRITAARLAVAARSFATKLSQTAPTALLPGETIFATITPSPNSRLLRLQGSAKALAELIDDHRIFMRLWGLLGIWSWSAATWRSPPKDALAKSILWTQICANVILQYLENAAYLGSKGVLNFGERKITRWYKWSCRFWALHVILEFVRLARVRTVRRREGIASGGEEKEDKIEKVTEEAKWWRDIYINAAWMPLTVHWSTERGIAGEGTAAALGLVAGVLGLKQAWKASS